MTNREIAHEIAAVMFGESYNATRGDVEYRIAAALTEAEARGRAAGIAAAAEVAEGHADPDVRRGNLRLAAEIGTDAGAGDALGSARTARHIAADIRALGGEL